MNYTKEQMALSWIKGQSFLEGKSEFKNIDDFISSVKQEAAEIMENDKNYSDKKNQPSCLGAVMPSIYSMKLHDVIALTPTSIEGTAVSYYSVMRVAGGWIYQVWDTEKQEYVRETFVPFNNDMMSV